MTSAENREFAFGFVYRIFIFIFTSKEKGSSQNAVSGSGCLFSSFLLVDISTSFGEVLYANVSLLRNRKFDLISQSGWIITTQLRKL